MILRLSSELVVIFLGVYGAFLAEDFRQDREEQQLARTIYSALAEELQDHVEKGQAVLDIYVAAQSEWQENAQRGVRPVPWVVRWDESLVGPPRDAWQATLGSGGITLIDTALFYRLAKYYRDVEMLLVPVDGPDPFAETEIQPFVDEGSSRFYDSDVLRPRYHQYLERRRIILQGAQSTINKAKILLGDLRARASEP